MTTTKTETTDERSARIAAELAEIRAEQARAAEAEEERLQARRAEVDARTTAEYFDLKAEAEAAVAQTRAKLEAAIEADPVTAAMTDWYAAQAHRRELFDRYLGARSRQGYDVTGAVFPRTDLAHLDELRERVAQRAAQERTDAERAELNAAYDNPQED